MTEEEKTLFSEIIACRKDLDRRIKQLMKYVSFIIGVIIFSSATIIVLNTASNTKTVKDLESMHDETLRIITEDFNNTLTSINEDNSVTTQEFYRLYFGTDYEYGSQTITQTVETKER